MWRQPDDRTPHHGTLDYGRNRSEDPQPGAIVQDGYGDVASGSARDGGQCAEAGMATKDEVQKVRDDVAGLRDAIDTQTEMMQKLLQLLPSEQPVAGACAPG